MFQRKPRRFRHSSNGRGHMSRNNGHSQSRPRTNSFSNNQVRNNFRQNQSAERLLEKYITLAKEAKSSGDSSLHENYLQHADHFVRIIEEKNKNKIKVDSVDKPIVEDKIISENVDVKKDEISTSE
jgi:hypothetical protein